MIVTQALAAEALPDDDGLEPGLLRPPRNAAQAGMAWACTKTDSSPFRCRKARKPRRGPLSSMRRREAGRDSADLARLRSRTAAERGHSSLSSAATSSSRPQSACRGTRHRSIPTTSHPPAYTHIPPPKRSRLHFRFRAFTENLRKPIFGVRDQGEPVVSEGGGGSAIDRANATFSKVPTQACGVSSGL